MAQRIKTSQRIINSSLELFNQWGERTISTNHIAAHMEISPGNLYYHFPNKQAIIAALFSEHKTLVLSFLHVPVGRALTIADKRDMLLNLLDAIWRYRFLYRDIEHLLHSDAELAASYRHFSQQCRAQARAIYGGSVDAGLLSMTPLQIEALSLNAWVIITSWIGFLCATRETNEQFSERALKRGVYQLLMLESGYVTEPAREAINALIAEFYVPLEQALVDD
ncbi:TetR/AcrR family transcriptional regulator [Pseudomonas sp.]|uniref:TetR/AcrR family transcriptional regulator n=1 Tax=Pseudomonas sp. TaxID=306 RepID=UPI002614278C|nr:TetR/AcrR family transcriptional regulator [Pseudomonas sp.]